MKNLLGAVFCLIAVATAVLGVRLSLLGADMVLSSGGEGEISVVVEALGEVTGINGPAAVLLAGIAILLTAIALTLKAIAEVKYEEQSAREKGAKPPNRLLTAIKHFDPTL